jgi:hypothetical protein
MIKSITTTPTKVFSTADLPAGRTGASNVFFMAKNEATNAEPTGVVYVLCSSFHPVSGTPATNNAYRSAYQPGEGDNFTGRDEATGQGAVSEIWAWTASGTADVTVRVLGV